MEGTAGRRGVIAEVVDRLGGKLKAPHMDPERVEEFVLQETRISGRAEVDGDCEGRSTVVIGEPGGGDLEKGLEYVNHMSAVEGEGIVWENIVNDAVTGKALVLSRRLAGCIPGLRNRRWHLVFQKMDLKGAFRQVPTAPGGGGGSDGWRGSPGWFGLVAGGIEHAQCNTTQQSVVRTLSGLKAVEYVRMRPPSGKPIVPPAVRRAEVGRGGEG